MDRKRAIACIKAAVCEGNMQTATRLYVENRVSYTAFRKAVAEAEAFKRKCLAAAITE